MRILVVDDDAPNRKLLTDIASKMGDCEGAEGGQEALSAFKKAWEDWRPFNLIFLDVLMPGKDGIQTLKEIKDLKPLINVIMLTGNATVDTAIQGMRLGAYDYLMKPTETETLVEKIMSAYKIKAEHEERIRQAEIEGLLKRRGW